MTKSTRQEFRGLSASDVAKRVANGQTNYLSKKSTRSLWNILKANLFTFFNFIVIGSAIVLQFMGMWKDALFGFAAIANVIIGVVQEYRSKRILDKLALIHAPRAKVVRDYKIYELHLDDIVMDDIVFVSVGDQIPTDGIVIKSDVCEVNEALLTGEIDPINKSENDTVMSGSIVVAGSAYIKTTAVGADSFASRISVDAKRFSLVHSELRNGIDKILHYIGIVIIPIMLIVIYGQIESNGGWDSILDGHSLLYAGIGAIASIVAMIPLGLVLLTSVAFAVGAVKLLSQQVLMQELAAVEGLARADVVCFDKTGTLTAGEITFDSFKVFNESQTAYPEVIAWFAAGGKANSTMKALYSHFNDDGDLNPSVVINFSSSRKWSAAAFHDGKAEGSWVLGAPEKMLDYNDDSNLEVIKYIDNETRRGRRVMLLSYQKEDFKHINLSDETIKKSFIPLVAITLNETLRHDIKQTIAFLDKQGISVRILSGDNPHTVAAIAREVGIKLKGDGYDARKLPVAETEMAKVLDEHVVFGRVNPDQKKSIVMALQSRGHVVAMVGDGVNDAMAVKQSDIGVAMGSGSAATRAVSRFVLLDSDFAHFPNIVAEGRKVIANIERVSVLFLSKTAYIMLISIIFGGLAWGFPYLPRHLSVLDGLTIGIPAFFLALLPSNQRYKPGFLNRTLKRSLPFGVIVALALTVMEVYMHLHGGNISTASSATAMTIVLGSIGLWILTTQARPLNAVKITVVAAMIIGLLGALLIPPIADFIGYEMPSLQIINASIIISLVGCALVEAVYYYVSKEKRA